MPNVIFTNNCNISCPFCFANENNCNDSNIVKDDFTIEDTWKISQFLNSEFRFCGGEPTLNPQILSAIDLILSSDKNIFIMTNGKWPDYFIEYIEKLPKSKMIRIRFLFNILEPSFYKNDEWERINNVLSIILPINATLGLTIYKKDFTYRYLIDLAQKYQIPYIRWSIAAPNLSLKNYNLEKDFKPISNQLYEFLIELNDLGINSIQDCGYIPLCFYDEKKLFNLNFIGRPMHVDCNTAPIDIGKEKAWRCYGLYSILNVDISRFRDEKELGGFFNRRTRILNQIPSYKECIDCKFHKKSCFGGCYAIKINKLQKQRPDAVVFPVDDAQEIFNCAPYKAASMVFKKNNKEVVSIHFGSSMINQPDENTIEFLNSIDGEIKISQLIDKWESNFSTREVAENIIIEKFLELFEKDAVSVNYDYKYRPESNQEYDCNQYNRLN